jgi:hypothetical protein
MLASRPEYYDPCRRVVLLEAAHPVIVTRNADQSRMCGEFPKGEIRTRVDDPPTVPAFHDYLRYLG